MSVGIWVGGCKVGKRLCVGSGDCKVLVRPCVAVGAPAVNCAGGGAPAPDLDVGVDIAPSVFVGQGVRVAPLTSGSGKALSLVAVASGAERVAVNGAGGVSGKRGS